MVASVLQCLVTLACLAQTTWGAAPLSYRSMKTVLLNHGLAVKLKEKCQPTCEDSNGDPLMGVHIRDPSSCQQYYICMPDGTLYEQPHVCQEEEIVNLDKLVCEHKINDGSEQCTISDPECDPNIPKVCYNKDTCPPSSEGLFPYAHISDCHKYHVCNFDESVEITCDKDGLPFFNGQECVAKSTECCECQAVCSEAWKFIPDPLDKNCQDYFLCQDLDGFIAGGKPYIATDEEKFKCPDGEKFDATDPTNGVCSSKATCATKENCVK